MDSPIMIKEPIISETGIPKGKGSDPFRYVAFLSTADKQAVLRGDTVLVRCPWSNHRMATTYKQVYAYRAGNGSQKFGHRNYQLNKS